MASGPLSPHTVTSFDEDLAHLRASLSRMGTLAAAQIVRATDALLAGEPAAAQRVIEGDIEIDGLQSATETLVLEAIARNAPLAEDLRDMVATLHIATFLERVGDYAKSIAKRVEHIAALGQSGPVRELEPLSALALALFQDAMAAYVDRDLARAGRVIAGDDAVDAEYRRTFHALLGAAGADAALLTVTVHLQAVAKSYERIADQATNIAEQVEFISIGSVRSERKTDNSL
jgi:phosphate transport system protein